MSPWMVRLVPQGRPRDSPRSGEWLDPLSVGGVGEAEGVAGGDEDVGVVQSRSTRADAMVRGMSSSNPLG